MKKRKHLYFTLATVSFLAACGKLGNDHDQREGGSKIASVLSPKLSTTLEPEYTPENEILFPPCSKSSAQSGTGQAKLNILGIENTVNYTIQHGRAFAADIMLGCVNQEGQLPTKTNEQILSAFPNLGAVGFFDKWPVLPVTAYDVQDFGPPYGKLTRHPVGTKLITVQATFDKKCSETCKDSALAAIKYLEAILPIRFSRPRDDKFIYNPGVDTSLGFVTFTSSSENFCWASGIGRPLLIGKPHMSVISLINGCGTGEAVHEIMHVLGLAHEQQRPDRDKYITINWNNIDNSAIAQFQMMTPAVTLSSFFDFDSIMLYNYSAFCKSTNGVCLGPVMTSIVPGKSLPVSNPQQLSQGDIQATRGFYGL